MRDDVALPSGVDAERAVLGSVLLDNQLLTQCSEVELVSGEFYVESHQRIYGGMLDLSERGHPIDPISLGELLRERGQYDAVGGRPYIASLVDLIPRLENIAYYISIIRAKATRRRLFRAGHLISQLALNEDTPIGDIVAEAEAAVAGLAKATFRDGPRPLVDVLDERLDELEIIAKEVRDGRTIGIPTAIAGVDRLLGGLQRKHYIIAARPSAGKTSFSLNLAAAAVNAGKRVLYNTAEMQEEECADRVVSDVFGVSGNCFLHGRFSREDWQALASARAWAAEVGDRFLLDETSAPSVSSMRAKAMHLKATVGLDLVMLDYLQLAEPDKATDHETTRLTRITTGLKQMQKDLSIPVVSLSQLSRVSARENRRPELTDLRGSGSIEQDGDVVGFLWIPEPAVPEYRQLYVAKHRGGPLGKVDLHFHGEHTRFTGWNELEHGGLPAAAHD